MSSKIFEPSFRSFSSLHLKTVSCKLVTHVECKTPKKNKTTFHYGHLPKFLLRAFSTLSMWKPEAQMVTVGKATSVTGRAVFFKVVTTFVKPSSSLSPR